MLHALISDYFTTDRLSEQGLNVLPEPAVTAIARVAQQAEEAWLRPIRAGRSTEEPDMTSRLAQAFEMTDFEVDGIVVQMQVVESLGRNTAERTLGADLVGVVRIEIDDMRVTKGFLAQAKRAGSQGVHFEPPSGNDYSHWLYRGSLRLEQSGVVSVTKPSIDLQEQCDNMLRVTPASFVFVYHPEQLAVVSAVAVRATANKPTGSHDRTDLGTKRLDDFLVHLSDCFIGDPKLVAADAESVRALAARYRAPAALLLTVTDGNQA